MAKRPRESSSSIVKLNVGGTPFTTSLASLQSVPDSLLGQLFADDSRFGEPAVDVAGEGVQVGSRRHAAVWAAGGTAEWPRAARAAAR